EASEDKVEERFSTEASGPAGSHLRRAFELNDDSVGGSGRGTRRGLKGERPMVNERQAMLEQSATIYFGPWYGRSPFFEATRRAGCTAYDVYNHMLLPSYYDDPVVEYWALLNDVVVWDVAVERTVEIAGPDADLLVDR